jgi:hypothetical protein
MGTLILRRNHWSSSNRLSRIRQVVIEEGRGDSNLVTVDGSAFWDNLPLRPPDRLLLEDDIYDLNV